MIATKTNSWKAATAEGLSFFAARMNTGSTVQFVGQSWENAGFFLTDSGNPRCDHKGNTVANFSVEPLDPTNASHVAQVSEWFG